MWPIIYRMINPWGLLVLLSSIGVIACWAKIKKLKLKKRKNATVLKLKQSKMWLVFLLCLVMISLMLLAYFSLDLIYKDYIEAEVTYTYYRNIKGLNFSEVCFLTDSGPINCDILTSDLREYQFVEGTTYKITYARRTTMLLDVAETD